MHIEFNTLPCSYIAGFQNSYQNLEQEFTAEDAV